MRILPLVAKGKTPISGGVYSATTNKKALKKYFRSHRDANYGVATGGASNVFVLDVDGEQGKDSLRILESKQGALPPTVTVRTGKGHHYYFRCAGVEVRNSAGRIATGIDIRGDGGYAVGPGSIHESGRTYEFVKGRALGEMKIAKAPKWLLKAIKKPDKKAKREVGLVQPLPLGKLDRANAYAEAARQRELERLSKAPKHQRNHTLNTCAFKLGQFLPYGLFDAASIKGDLARVAAEIGLDDEEIGPTIKSGLNAGSASPRRLPFLKLHQDSTEAELPDMAAADLSCDLSKLGETDTDNAQRFATRFTDKVIYTPGRSWLVYDGRRWCPDAVHRCIEFAKEAARLIADESQYLDNEQSKAARANFSKASLSKGALDRMLDLAKGLLTVEDSKLDADQWLFNTETATIDLRTGFHEPHDPRDLLTKIAPVAADRLAKCAAFKKFLNRITGKNKNLKAYIQKAIGYSLTGSTREQVFFFCYGKSGSNGKSTLVNLIRDMLGEYGRHTPTETLMVKQYDNAIPNDLARLAGVRMVTAIETNYTRQLDEAKIKGMTGGEKVAARFMRQEYFEFTPAFKLWLVANDRPRVRGTDSALWRRVRVIPFDVKIPDDECDSDLPEKLKAEWPGILAWAVRGCLRWQAKGLAEPLVARKASDRWYKAADHLKRFVGDVVISAPGHSVPASSLFEHYSQWCYRNGEEPLTINKLKDRLSEAHDMTHKRTKRGSEWIGVKVRLT
jgi:putative DNA primase/helicase